MAVNKVPQKCVLQIIVQNGTNDKGQPKHASRNYACKVTATDATIADIGNQLASLQSCSVMSVGRVDYASLINE